MRPWNATTKPLRLTQNTFARISTWERPYTAYISYDEAIACFNVVTRSNPKDSEAHYIKGNSFLALKRYDAAIGCYDEAIKLGRKTCDIYCFKGNAHANVSQYPHAMRCFDDAL